MTTHDPSYEPSPINWVREHVLQMEATGAPVDTPMGKPVIVVAYRGRTSGLLRKTAVMRVEHGGSYALVASKGGARRNPEWFNNVVEHPEIEVQDGTARRVMRARELSGLERTLWWERAVAAFPPYADYQDRTDRIIPVLLAEPAAASGSTP